MCEGGAWCVVRGAWCMVRGAWFDSGDDNVKCDARLVCRVLHRVGPSSQCGTCGCLGFPSRTRGFPGSPNPFFTLLINTASSLASTDAEVPVMCPGFLGPLNETHPLNDTRTLVCFPAAPHEAFLFALRPRNRLLQLLQNYEFSGVNVGNCLFDVRRHFFGLG